MSKFLGLFSLFLLAPSFGCAIQISKSEHQDLQSIGLSHALDEFEKTCGKSPSISLFKMRNAIFSNSCNKNFLPIIMNYHGDLCGLKKEIAHVKYESSNVDKLSAQDFLEKIQFEKGVEQTKSSEPFIFHLSLEYTGKSQVGGVGGVVDQISRAQVINGVSSSVVTPFYEFWLEEKYNSQFMGCYSFPYENDIHTTTVYKSKEKNVDHILIYPDRKKEKIFQVKEKKVYDWYQNSDTWNRCMYFSAAATAFFSQAKSGKTPQILTYHNPIVGGISSTLLRYYYNPKRLEAGRIPIGMLQTGHGAAKTDDYPFEASWLNRVGAKTNYTNKVTALGLAMLNSHATNWVSQGQREKSLSGNFLVDIKSIAKFLDQHHRYYGITNGVFLKDYVISNASLYKDSALVLPRDNIISAKNEMKRKLFESGLIPDPVKPLFLWIGRMDSDIKGMDFLPSMMELAKSKGAQSVIMGIRVEHGSESEAITTLRNMAVENPHDFSFHDDLKFQTKPFVFSGKEMGFTQGAAIRYAASAFMLPSRTEGAPLVILELYSTGTFVVASDGGGISDYANPEGSFIFPLSQDDHTTIENAKNKMEELFTVLALPVAEQNRKAQFIVSDTAEKWDWTSKNGPLKKYAEVYQEIIKNIENSDLEYEKDREAAVAKYFSFENLRFY